MEYNWEVCRSELEDRVPKTYFTKSIRSLECKHDVFAINEMANLWEFSKTTIVIICIFLHSFLINNTCFYKKMICIIII